MLLIVVFGPVYWALNTALLPKEKLGATPAAYLPIPPRTDSFSAVIHYGPFLNSLWNSVLVAGGAALISVLLGSFAACALGRYQFRGRRAILYLLLSMSIFPQIAVVGALFHLSQQTGLYNTRTGLLLSHLLLTLPFTIWVLTTFFRAMPVELEESAYVDGATPFQTFWKILLPLSAPGIATTGILAFIASWNEYLFALSLTADNKARTATVIIAQFKGTMQYEIPWGEIMAASLLATAPLIVVVLIFQRFIVGGLTAGGVKG
ncbi:carbohydrate ABC transporter permease [soil metagenome]